MRHPWYDLFSFDSRSRCSSRASPGGDSLRGLVAHITDGSTKRGFVGAPSRRVEHYVTDQRSSAGAANCLNSLSHLARLLNSHASRAPAAQMTWSLRSLLRASRRNWQHLPQRRSFHSSTLMASASTSAVLYATVVSASQWTGAVPEDAKDLAHHVKGGKGFVNPWQSYQELSVPRLLSGLLWYIQSRQHIRPCLTKPSMTGDKSAARPTNQTLLLPPFPSANPNFFPLAKHPSSEQHG